jgi:hypothetical protein
VKDSLKGLGEAPRAYTGKFKEQGTDASGFASDGPYHCEDCIHQVTPSREARAGDPDQEKGSCYHPAVMGDAAVLELDMPDGTPGSERKQKDGSILVDIERECCRYVNQPAE